MSKVLWHTMTIKVPSEMVEITKTGKVSIKKTLTKMNNISKSQGYPSIKLVKSSDNKPHIITDGKEWNIEQLKTTLNKSNELANKNKGKVLTKKLIQPLKDNKFIEKIKKEAKRKKDIKFVRENYQPQKEPYSYGKVKAQQLRDQIKFMDNSQINDIVDTILKSPDYHIINWMKFTNNKDKLEYLKNLEPFKGYVFESIFKKAVSKLNQMS